MIEINKKKDENGYDNFRIITDDGSFDIKFGGTLDLYWSYWPKENIKNWPVSKTFTITKEKDMFVVDGPAVQRLMARVNLEDNESLYYFQKCLEQLGVNRELKKAGLQEGDTVKIVDWELEWYD